MIQRSLVSALDQAVISGLNFSIGLALIGTVSKPEYGLYVQLFAAGVLLSSLIDALVGNGITNALARGSAHPLEELLRQGRAVVVRLAPFVALLGALTAGVLNAHDDGVHQHGPLVLAYCAYVWTLILREGTRTRFHLRELPQRVLLTDGLYAVLTLLLGLAVHWTVGITLWSLFGCLALANLVGSGVSMLWERRAAPPATHHTEWEAISSYWRFTQWAVVGVLLGWVANNVFLYASGLLLGLAATAELNAGRLLLMPLTLLSVAWGQSSRTALARLVQAMDAVGLKRYVRRSITVLLAVCIFYGVGLWAAWPWVLRLGPFEKYPHLSELVVWWLPYMLLFSVKFIGTIVLTVLEHYRPMLIMTSLSLLLQLTLLNWLPGTHGAPAVIWCLMAAECFELLVIWRLLMPQAWRNRTEAQHG